MSVPTPIITYSLSDATIKGLLPDGYTPLAYIEFPGSGGGIDLGYKFNALTDSYEIEFLASDTTQNGMILASIGTYNSWLYYYGGDGVSLIKTYITDSDGTLRNRGHGPTDLHKHIVRYHDRKWYIDIGDSSATGTYEAFSFVQDTNNLCLGGYNTSSLSHPFKGKIYRVKIWHNDALQRDLIPASHSSGNGYYDLVTRTFYTRTELIAGPELAVGKGGGKSLPEEYLLVEYLQMDPGLYINTGQAIAIDDVTKTEVWMWYADGNTRDLMGWSLSAAEYWGCTANSTWEKVTGVSPITQRQKVVYNHTAAAAGTYQIGAVSGNYSTRTKYIELVKITIGSSLKRNLYACYRKSDGKPGMYDTVNGVFYTNAGSGEFILGPSITNCYTYEPINGKNLWKKDSTWNATNSTLSRLSNLGFNGIPGPWTISFDAYASLNTSAFIDICDLGGKTISLTTTPQHYFITATAKNYYTVENINGFFDIASFGNGVTVYLSNIAMYNSDIDLGYKSSNANGLYINCNSIYDADKGWVADFTDNTAHLSATIPAVGNNFSVAWWELSSNFNANSMPWGIYPFNPLFAKCLNTADGGSNPWYKLGTTVVIDNIPNNVWHHFVVTGNGSVNYLYVDGVKYGLSKTFKGLTGTSLVINGFTLTVSYCRNPKISNFQIFNVALTDEQVKKLYGE